MLHGARVVPGTVLGIAAGDATQRPPLHGARRRSRSTSADDYADALRDDGNVIADFAERRAEIERAARRSTPRAQDADARRLRGLLDEVTALVECPSVYVGSFDAAFLDVPQECLILTMRQNQKYFPLFDARGKLLPALPHRVATCEIADPRHIVGGNERVVRPRLADARFFYDQDRKTRLEARVPQLAQGRLSQQARHASSSASQRIQLLAGAIARAARGRRGARASAPRGSRRPIC